MENTTDKHIHDMQKQRMQHIYNSFEKAQTTDAQSEKVAKVMREFKDGKLKDSHGNVVTSHEQALAIALSQSEEIKKAEDTLDLLEKARNMAQIGELREFGGRQYIKTINGWKFHGKGGGAKAQSHVAGAAEHNQSQGGESFDHRQFLDHPFTGSTADESKVMAKMDKLVEQGKLMKRQVKSGPHTYTKYSDATEVARKIINNPSEAAHELANTPELRADMMSRVNVELNRRGQAVYTTKDHEQALSNALSAMNHEGKFNSSSQTSSASAPKYGQTGYAPASKEQLIADVKENYRRSSLAVQNAKVKEAVAKYFPENASSQTTSTTSAKSLSDFMDTLPNEGSFKVKKNGKLSNATYTKESFKQSLKDANMQPGSTDHGFEGFEAVVKNVPTNTAQIPGGDRQMKIGIGGRYDKEPVSMPSFENLKNAAGIAKIEDSLKQLTIAERGKYLKKALKFIKEDENKVEYAQKFSDRERMPAKIKLAELRKKYVGHTTVKEGNTEIKISPIGEATINGKVVQIDDDSKFVKLGGGGRSSSVGAFYGPDHFAGQLQGGSYVSATNVLLDSIQNGKSIKDAVKSIKEHSSDSIRRVADETIEHLGLTKFAR